jgi:hypothetical protein
MQMQKDVKGRIKTKLKIQFNNKYMKNIIPLTPVANI